MDYDDNDAQDQNLHLVGEENSKVSPVLHSYALPKFDFDDNLHGHLRFDSLVENEVFLGITSQEDNQWIEEYSRGTSAIQFSSSAAELRHKNVWSEATSSESVEMLLKSVRQEEGVVEEVIFEESDACDRPDSLTKLMDPSLKQCDVTDRLIRTPNVVVVADVAQENFVGVDSEQPDATFTSETQKTQISGGEFDSVVTGDLHSLSFGEKKTDKTCDDVNQEGSNLENDSVINELQQDSFASKVECGNAGTSQNVDPSIQECQENPQEVPKMCIENASGPSDNFHSSDPEQIIKGKENSMDHPTNSGVFIEISTYSEERLSVVTNVKSSVGGSMVPTGSLPIGSCDIHEKPFVVSTSCECSEIQDITLSEVTDIPKSDAGSLSSLSLVQSHSVEEPINGVGSDDQHVTAGASKVSMGDNQFGMGEGSDVNTVDSVSLSASSSAEMATEEISNKGVAAAKGPSNIHIGGSNDDNGNLPGKISGLLQVDDEIHSSDKDVTFKERGDAGLPLDSSDIDMDVGGAPCSQKYVAPSSCGEGCEGVIEIAQESESNMAVVTDAVASMESSKLPSSDMLDSVQFTSGAVVTADIATNIQPRSPILGVSLLHDDEEEKVEAGLSMEGSSQKGALEVDRTRDCALDVSLPVVKKDAVSDGAEKVEHSVSGFCDTRVENCNAIQSEQTPEDSSGGLKCSRTLETNTLPCDSLAEGGSNGESGGLLDAKESTTGEDQVEPLNLAVNVLDKMQASAGPSESDTNPMLQNDGDSASLDKPQVFSFSDIKRIEPSQSTEDKHEATKGSIHENASLSKVNNDGEEVHVLSKSSATTKEKSFTFEVSASAGSGDTTIQNLSTSKNMKVTSVSSSGGILDSSKVHDDSLASPQTPSSAAIDARVKGKSERKPRRKSVGRETEKGDLLKEMIPSKRSGRVEKLPALLTSPATRHVKPLEELKPNAITESSNPKPEGILPIPMSNPNNSTPIFEKSFTDDQQLQLRAQILVYGSLISGMPPEELHMSAAFGQSDGGRKAWEAAWHASLERIRGHKSQANNPGTPMPSRSGNRDPDQGIKFGSAQSKIISTPTAGLDHACIPSSVVTSMIPISSPLWSISTPCDGLQSSVVPRSPLFDSRQMLSPVHLYQTPQGQSFGGLNPSWPSQGHFPGQWLASSPVASFGARFSALPITEAVKLTTVKESSASGVSVIPVDLSAGSSISLGLSSLSNVRKPTVLSDQPSSDGKSRKRKKAAASEAVSQMPVTSQAQVPSLSAPVPHFPWATHTEGRDQISFLPQNQTNSGTTPVLSSHSPTSTASLIPIPITSKSNSGSYLSAISPASTPGHPIVGDQNLEKIATRADILSKIEEFKLQAADAAVHAASAVSHCQGVWNQMEKQKSSGLVSDDEAKLASSAASIAAAASVAKVAAAAAKIASNVAEQARLMADEVFQSSRTESCDQSSIISHASVISNFDKATPASILNSTDGSDHATSIISAAREAARRRIKAASDASKHAENLDAIVKAAELAAEAVSQAGKIVATVSPFPLKGLFESGQEGWKAPQSSNQQCNYGKQNVEDVSNDKEIHIVKHDLSLQEDSRDLGKNQMIMDGMSGSITNFGNDKSTARARKSPDSSKTVGVISESEFEPIHTLDVNQNMPSDTWKENTIKEGCFVEVCRDDNKNKRAWFVAKVLNLKDGKAFVCYNEIQSGEEQLKEWIPLKLEGTEAPRIRVARSITAMQNEGTRKRGRKVLTDYNWCCGDRVDVWVQDSWFEAAVLETNKIDATSLTVEFPGQGEKVVVRSWHVRPSLIWKDGKWIEWSNVNGSRSSEGDTPHEKRRKFGRAGVEVTEKDKSSNIDLPESERLQESHLFPLPVQGSSFVVGKSSRDEKPSTRRPIRSGLHKERSGVVIGVPKPGGKKQKFMDVSKHYVANGNNKKNTPNDSGKLASYSMPQAPGQHELKNSSKNDGNEKQIVEMKSKLPKSQKPPLPSTLVQKDKPKSSKHVSHDASMNDKTAKDSVGIVENVSDHQNRISNKEDATEGPSSSTLPSDISKEALTSKIISQNLNKRKFERNDGKSTKVEVKDKSTSEAEPRRSNRKIQPTPRLLEGLQSSLTMTKIPTGSHAIQRSRNKVTSKGSANPSRDNA